MKLSSFDEFCAIIFELTRGLVKRLRHVRCGSEQMELAKLF